MTTQVIAGAQWEQARKLYNTYEVIADTFNLAAPPLDLDQLDLNNPASLSRVNSWLDEMDSHIQAQHLRRILRTELASSEERLHALITHHLHKVRKTELDRAKLDFLLVEYFAVCAPANMQERSVTRDDVAAVLEPVLDQVAPVMPELLDSIAEVIETLKRCDGLRDMRRFGVIEKGRELKDSCGELYFEPKSLVSFTYLNYCIRRESVRLMNADLKAIGDGLRGLEERGVGVLDCSEAGLSAQESVASLKQLWETWELPINLDYLTSDAGFERLMAIRTAVEGAMFPSLEHRVQDLSKQVFELRSLIEDLRGQLKNSSAHIAALASEVSLLTAAAAQPKAEPARAMAAAAGAGANGKSAVAAAKPAPAAAPKPQQPKPEVTAEVEKWVSKMQKLLGAHVKGKESGASMVVGKTRADVSPAEVAAFVDGSSDLAKCMQRSVGIRMMLINSIDSGKDHQTGKLKDVMLVAEHEREEIVKLMKKHQGADKVHDQEKLAETARRLSAVIERAKTA